MIDDRDRTLLEKLNSSAFDAIDWGSSKGSSIEHISKNYGYEKIVGVDLDQRKVSEARARGKEVICSDAGQLPVERGVVSASFLFHFLEHLPGRDAAEAVLRKACIASRDYVVVRQPFFGADEELLRYGLKLAWSTWSTHKNPMTTLDFFKTLEKFRAEGLIQSYRIGYAIPIPDTGNDQILPFDAPGEALFYDGKQHEPKPVLLLNGIYREVCAIACIRDDVDWAPLERTVRLSRWIVSR